MKTFKEYVTRDITNPYNQYRDGSYLLGPGMGQYHPIADLNANRHDQSKKQLLGPVKPRTGEKEVTKSDLDQLERYADRLFGAVGCDVEFTRHFLDSSAAMPSPLILSMCCMCCKSYGLSRHIPLRRTRAIPSLHRIRDDMLRSEQLAGHRAGCNFVLELNTF